jgi:hypothetical protein
MESTLLEPLGFIVNSSRVFRSTAHRGGVAGGFAGAAADGEVC